MVLARRELGTLLELSMWKFASFHWFLSDSSTSEKNAEITTDFLFKKINNRFLTDQSKNSTISMINHLNHFYVIFYDKDWR